VKIDCFGRMILRCGLCAALGLSRLAAISPTIRHIGK
jgi:hypothetical protein